jgi:hypothetical protein
MSIRAWWKQFWCAHSRARTTVTAYHGPVLETETVCERCGKVVPPTVSFSHEWKLYQLEMARKLKSGQSKVIFGEQS